MQESTSAAALPDIADLDNENHIQTTDKAVAVSSAVKSYAAVTKASVVTAARPHLAHIYSDTPSRAHPKFTHLNHRQRKARGCRRAEAIVAGAQGFVPARRGSSTAAGSNEERRRHCRPRKSHRAQGFTLS